MGVKANSTVVVMYILHCFHKIRFFRIVLYVSGSDKRVHLVKIFETSFLISFDSYVIGEREALQYCTPFTRYGPLQEHPCLHLTSRTSQFQFITLQSVYSLDVNNLI